MNHGKFLDANAQGGVVRAGRTAAPHRSATPPHQRARDCTAAPVETLSSPSVADRRDPGPRPGRLHPDREPAEADAGTQLQARSPTEPNDFTHFGLTTSQLYEVEQQSLT
ncbi:hypothetical protein GCM10011609_57020 [Lentzea pudingi]|uniref:Uncharacterized protein n=1 Tax=Lentzea pudingi TaxID=1789439 RepID=A0ABQ2IJA1_9PSEU|nr:hypothetical protein GCM10011609_57020 [Lentzea pudingi]